MSEETRRKDKPTIKAGLLKGGIARWSLPAALALACVAALTAVNAVSPYLFKGATLEGEVATQLRATTGLAFSAGVSGRFDLLPRPHVVFYRSHIADPSRTIAVDAEEFDGDVRLLPLIVGRIELTSATLIKPQLAIDLDAKPTRSDSLIGRAMRLLEPGGPPGERRLGTVTLVDGTATIRSKAGRPVPDLEDLNLTLDWHDLDSPATLTGSLTMRKTAVDVAAWVAQPASLIGGDHSAVALHLHSAPFDISATGDLVSAATTAFRGHVSARAPTATTLLHLVGSKASLLAPFANLSLNSDASVSIDAESRTSIDLPNLTLRADGNEYEGTLAFQSGARPSLSGTLASEQLMLGPFLTRMPKLKGPDRGWSRERIIGKEPQLLDLDLRISATHLRLAPVTIDNAALAVMTRNDRTEVALVEGKVYGGAAKCRVAVGVSREGVGLRGTASLTGADASTMTWDLFGRQLAAGTLSASVNFETTGDSPAALMRNMQGWAKGTGFDGEISGVDVGRALVESRQARPEAWMGALRGGRTPFRTLTFGARVSDGVATLDDATLKSQTLALAVSGSADLGARRLALRAVATPPSVAPGQPPNAPAPRLDFTVDGPFDGPQLAPSTSATPATKPASAR